MFRQRLRIVFFSRSSSEDVQDLLFFLRRDQDGEESDPYYPKQIHKAITIKKN